MGPRGGCCDRARWTEDTHARHTVAHTWAASARQPPPCGGGSASIRPSDHAGGAPAGHPTPQALGHPWRASLPRGAAPTGWNPCGLPRHSWAWPSSRRPPSGSTRRGWATPTSAGPGQGAAPVPRQAGRRWAVATPCWPSRPWRCSPGTPRGGLACTALPTGAATAAASRPSAAAPPGATRSSW